MPALSFRREWINALLTGDKTQTTRRPTPAGKPSRFTVGDTASIYIEQRGKITSKPIYQTTKPGRVLFFQKVLDGVYPSITANNPDHSTCYTDFGQYYAHFLGTVKIVEVKTIQPSQMTGEDLEAWAWADGFYDFDEGDRWFVKHHSTTTWSKQTWEVIRWNSWEQRYFEPTEVP